MMCDFVLVNINTGEKFILRRDVTAYKCGRGKANQVITSSILASREHCMFLRIADQMNVLDLGSSNGIFINGQRQASRVMTPIKINDIIGLGCSNLSPDQNPSSTSAGIFMLLLLETESVADLPQATADTTAKITSDPKRRHSRDSTEFKVPAKIPKIEVPDIIDISDDSGDEIVVPKNTENKSCDKRIVGEPDVSPIKARTSVNGSFSSSKELSRSLQENAAEFKFPVGTSTGLSANGREKAEGSDTNFNSALNAASSTCLSTNNRKRSEDDNKNLNSSIVAGSSTCLFSDGRKNSVESDKNSTTPNVPSASTYFPKNVRKRSEDGERTSKPKIVETSVFLPSNARKISENGEKSSKPKVVETSVFLPSNARKISENGEKSSNSREGVHKTVIPSTNGRKSSTDGEDSDKNVNRSNARKSTNSSHRRKNSEENNENHCEIPKKIKKLDEFQTPASSRETISAKPTNLRGEGPEKDEAKKKKALNLPNKKVNSSKSSRLKEQVVPSIEEDKTSSNENENAQKPQEAKKTNGFFEEDEDSDFLAEDLDADELNLAGKINDNGNWPEPEEPNLRIIENGPIKQLVKYEPELNIIDEGESGYDNFELSMNEKIVPTPIKLKRVKQEPKTRYSEFDVVVLSDDEDGVFPASQLFGDESDDENKDQTKAVKVEDVDGENFENSRDDVSDIIILSDSEDEDNPWYDRLIRSQLLNESRLSLANSVKEEAEEENVPFGVNYGEDLEELFADELEENENVAKDPREEEPMGEEEEKAEEEEEAEEDEGLFSAQDFLEENNEEITIEDVKEEIFDLCFTAETKKTKKTSPDETKRKDKRRKSTEERKSIEEIVSDPAHEKQSDKKVETNEKIGETLKTVANKDREEKTSRKIERIEDIPLPPERRISRKKRLSDNKIWLEKQRLWSLSMDEKMAADAKSQKDETSTAEKRSPKEKIVTAEKGHTDNKKFTEEKRISVEKRPSIEKSSLSNKKSLEQVADVEKRPSIEKSSLSNKKSLEKAADVEKRTSIEKLPLPKQKSSEKSTEIPKTSTKVKKSRSRSSKNEVEKRQRSSEAKSSNMSDSSNDKSDFSESKSKNVENLPENRQTPKESPTVILTKVDNSVKTVQLVDAPFLVNGRHRGVSCKVTTIDRSSDKQGSSVASTSTTNEPIKTPPRKLTTKEKKEEALKIRIEQKVQKREQLHRLQKNKWAAKCVNMLPNKKPALSPFTPQERKDIHNDRMEKLKQIANEKKAAEEIQPSTTRRVVKAKAKVTTNSRNDFLVKELEEQAKLNAGNVDRLSSENVESLKDKSLETRTENSTGEISSAHKEKSPRGRKAKKDNKEQARHSNEDNLPKEKAKEKSPEVAKEIPANSEINRHSSDSIKTIGKKTKFLEESEVPKNFSEKLSKPNTLKKASMANGLAHVFGEQSRIVGQNLMANTKANVEESSHLVSDTIKIPKVRKSVLKENREPNSSEEVVKTKSKKRVSFNDLNTRVEIFDIEPGNSLKKCVAKDAPIVVKQLPKCNSAALKACCPKMEQFLLRIFKWNPVWLEEQKELNAAPPVVDEKKLSPMLSKYSSYDDYYKTTEPLLALELWNGISRDYESKVNQKACFQYSIVNHSIALTTVPSTTIRVTTLMLEVVVSKKDAEKQAHPVYGDLVFFEYISNRKRKESLQRWKVFAYVTNVRQTTITPMTHFNRDLLNFEKNPHTLLTYTVLTKPLDASDIQTNKVSRLRTISYLRSNIRMIQALQNLPVSPLCSIILHPKVEDYQLPVVPNLDSYPLVTKDKLNPRQLEAVARVTEAAVQRLPKVCLIQGPPGTGKSRVIVNLVTQILYGNNRYHSNKKLRILVCAPSNAAIDEIVLRLLDVRRTFQKGSRFNMVRIGRIESMHPQVKEVSVSELAGRDIKKIADAYMSPAFTSDSVEEEKRYLQARINALQLEMSSQNPLHQRQTMRKLGDVQAKYNLLMNRNAPNQMDGREKLRLQRAAENTLLKNAEVITCTLTSCYTNQMESIFGGKEAISVCIVDEATQSSEAENLIPLMLGVRTLVLVGDTNQLPATILSQKAKQYGLEQSLFARIQNAFDGQKKDPVILLDTQYRMTVPVASWPNNFFYGGAIKNDPVKYPFPFHCYKIMDLDSTQNEDKFSNTDEASFVANVLYTLMTRSKLDHLNVPVKIGVITPYNNQKQLVMQKIRERMANVSEKVRKKIVHEVNTVDSFQGQERDVIIMSCVRSNGIGFLSDRQRLCVALTRAKHSLILCGNFRTFKRDQMWNALLTDARERGVYVTIKAKAETDEIKSHIIR